MNNPVNMSDPSGNFSLPLPFIFGVLEAIGGAIVSVLSAPIAMGIAVIGSVGFLIYSLVKSNNSETVKGSELGSTNENNKINKSKGNTSSLPNQGSVDGGIPDAPRVHAGKQGKHVIGHPNFDSKEKTSWPEGEDGVELTQEGWMKGRVLPGNSSVRVWDTGRVIGPNGETKVNVKFAPSDGMIHGYPTK